MTKLPSPVIPWSVAIAVADIPETGRRFDLVPDAETRDAIAKVAGVAALPRLEAGFDLTRYGNDGLHIVGRVSATIGQTCVVTLEPIQNEVDETIDLVFMPQPVPAAETENPEQTRASHADDDDVDVDVDIDDAPEVLRDGVVDLGAIAIEFLMLGTDPYPRKPGAVFDAPSAGDPASHPFAALAALKKGEGSND